MKVFIFNATIILLFVLLPAIISAQTFVDIDAGIMGVSNSSVTWGDYDNDMDMDILICGENNNGASITKLYNNNNGIFTDTDLEFAGLKNGWVRWGDYDNDGDLDLLATGNNAGEQTFLYKNESNSFIEVNPGLDYFGEYSSVSWNDYDNDGDLDIFITGNWNSKLYQNQGDDIFIDTEQEFVTITSSRSSWADFDKDGDMDLLLTGDTGAGMKLYCYINNKGEFEEIEFANMGFSSGSVEWGDYDNDGDLDILIMGFNDYIEPEANIYRNDGYLIFTNIYAGIPPVAMGNATWGDYDNDGDLDILISGKLAGCGIFTTKLYENTGNDFFVDATAGLTAAERSSIAWGDYDNDRDLDILLAGLDYGGNSFTTIYQNNFNLPNLLPQPPQGLSVLFEDEMVILNWDKASDPQTPQEGLFYNIRIGTNSSASNTMSPMAFMENGQRKIYDFGNTSQSNSWRLTGLEPGNTYYWSVQTIDNTFGGSEFSEEHLFYYSLTNTDEFSLSNSVIQVYPNPANDYIVVNVQEGNRDNLILSIYALNGTIVLQKNTIAGELIDISNIDEGIYFIEAVFENKLIFEKLIIK